MRAVALLALLAACAHKPVPLNLPDADGHRARPAPLAQRDFHPAQPVKHTLSNGVEVRIAADDEVPLWSVRALLRVGDYADPQGKEGLAEVTLDMLNEGAGGLSAEAIGRTLTTLGSSLGTYADYDGGAVTTSGIVRNLEPTLDLFTAVLREPDFPEDDWELVRKRRLAQLRSDRESPDAIARDVFRELLYGDAYRGRPTTEASLRNITTADMRDWYKAHIGPQNLTLLVGGDVNATTLLPLLEARLASWSTPDLQTPPPSGAAILPKKEAIYLVDKPGAAQSVLRAGTVVGQRTDDDWFDFSMGSLVLGGAFSARMNMNLREDKGYTYGARCGALADVYGPALWYCGASVQTAVTAPALSEMRREILEIRGDRPVTPEELAYFQSYEVNGYPADHEEVDALLGEQETMWRYGLPGDWPDRFLPGVQAVTTESANQALQRHILPDHLLWLVVGDRATVLPELQALGLPIVELNRDGSLKEN